MSVIFARPNLEDNFFKQTNDSTLTLSGQNKIASISGLSINNGGGVYIPIILTGGTSGHTLTYINDQMVLRASGAGATPLFDSNRVTTREIIPPVNVGGTTVQAFLEGYFFPSVGPSSSLSIATGGSVREFGDSSVGNLSWNVTKKTNLIGNIGLITAANGVYGTISASTGGTQSNTSAYTFPSSTASPVGSGTTATTASYSITAKTSTDETTISTATITWSNRKFYFANATQYTGSGINPTLSAQTGELSATKALSTGMTLTNQFFYYAYPKVLGTPTFVVNGLINNAWGNLAYGTLFTTTFVNNKGYSNQYYVARSDNRITGTFTIVVS